MKPCSKIRKEKRKKVWNVAHCEGLGFNLHKKRRKEGRKESKEGGREGGKKGEGGKEEEIKSNDVDFYCL